MVSLIALRRVSRVVSGIIEWHGAKIMNRTLRTSTFASAKLFTNIENSTMYASIKSKPECQTTVVQMSELPSVDNVTFEEISKQNWLTEAPVSVAHAFALASAYGSTHGLQITDEALDNLCDAVKAKCEEMTDAQLLSVLQNLSLWKETESIKSRNFDLWRAVDKACVTRVKTWERATLLLVADHWYRLNLARPSKFMVACIRKLGRKPQKLPPAHLVQTLLYVNAQRRYEHVVDMFEMQHAVESCSHALSLEDLAVVAAAFFKNETRIRSERLLSTMAEAVREGAATAANVPLAALLKALRYSSTPSMADQLYVTMGQLQGAVPRLSLLACTHAALVGTNIQLLHEGLVCAVAERFAREAAAARLKDLERLALVLGMFDMGEPCFFEALLHELRSPAREDEHRTYPKCLPRTLYYLSQKRIFPLDLLERVMQPTYIENVYGSNPHGYGLELLSLDIALKLECPSYDGPSLEPSARAIIAKQYRQRVPALGAPERGAFTDRLLGEIQTAATEAAGGRQHAAARHLLPHCTRADVVIRVDAESAGDEFVTCLPMSDVFLATPPDGEPRRAPDDGAVWVALVAAGWNCYLYGDGVGRHGGTLASRLRQLAALGYRPMMVPFAEWKKLTIPARPDYVRQLLREAVASPAASDVSAAGAL